MFIRGSEERAEEIKHILIDEWGGSNCNDLKCNDDNYIYYIDEFGRIYCTTIGGIGLDEAIEHGWMKEYILLEKQKFKPFDKVVVKTAYHSKWYADFYSHEDKEEFHFIGGLVCDKENTMILPFNEETARLIGTTDEWK